MKKLLITFLFLLLFLLMSCKKEEGLNNEVEIINYNLTNKEEEFKYSINYPKIKQKEIDNFVEQEIMSLFEKLKLNYQANNVYIKVDYDVYKSRYAVSYLFDFLIYNKNKIERDIKKAYNFDVKTNEMIVLDEYILKDVYLPLINNKLKAYELNLNIYDIKALKYIINEKSISFIIPKEITQKNILKIEIPNRGVDYISINLDLIDNNQKLVALTFDDGPSSKTIDLVNLLNKYNVKATFFLLGERVNYYPRELKYIYENNHEIGNHSYSHPDFKKIDLIRILSEIDDTEEIIYQEIHSFPKLFRFPYGSYDNFILNYIDYPIILWNVDSEDWKYDDSNKIYDNVIKNLHDNSVVIFHDFQNYRKEAIEMVIKQLIELDYSFLTISEFYQFFNEENIVYGKVY